jgi:uncharacterized phage protein gp47/JayE
MPWPIPAPETIAAKAAGIYEGTLKSPDGTPIDASSPNTVLGATTRVVGMSAFELYLFQAYTQAELWPDTAQDNLDRIAGVWGLTRIAAQVASGTVSVSGTVGAPIPSGVTLADSLGNLYTTTAPGTVAADGAALLPVSASVGGVAGNLAAGAILTIVVAVAGVAPQQATAQPPGFSDGEPEETNPQLSARVLARIRNPGNGGSEADYEAWAQAASSAVAYVAVQPGYTGAGTVGVFVAGAGPAASTGPEVAAVQAYLQPKRPVTAQVTAYAATVQPLDATITLNPDTLANRAAATAAFANWIETDAAIGGTMYLSRMNAAVAAGDGEFSHETASPTADVALGVGTIAGVGVLSFG